ncbi:hypothetical protein [uncultured Roseibium sp.]|uniref:hypothetical protein n=1 Tax=uncultured Roseibium sp. TaxID=1936171 RepID=UPI0026281552|nr:hypothetical protein [uncultured Roseibium sp.]
MQTRSVISVFLVSVFALVALPAAAEELPEAVWAGSSARPEGGLPDGKFAVYRPGRPDAVAAWYGSPTRRYGHGILGDAIEAGSLHVAMRNLLAHPAGQ